MPVEHTIERMDNRPAVTPLHLWPGAAPLYTPKECEKDVVSLLKEERALMFEPGEPFVRRVLDLGANVGEFALFCRYRWPYAWVDCVEEDAEKCALCTLNGPTGTRVLTEPPGVKDDLRWDAYDLVRVSKSYKGSYTLCAPIVFLDGLAHDLSATHDLKACGMRRKNEPFQWWVRKS